MRTTAVWFLTVLIWAGTARSSFAQGHTLEDVLAAARQRAPEILAARARVEESRGRLIGVSSRFRDNPSLDVDAGPRASSDRSQTWDVSAGFGQIFETGGQRTSRISMAESDILRDLAAADDVARVVTRDVAIAFTRALGMQERSRLLVAAEQLARALHTTSQRRYQAGDIAALDLNLARIAAARATAERIAADAELGRILLPLRLVLALNATTPLALAGSLERTPVARVVLAGAVNQMPAMRQVDAEIAQAHAEIRLGDGMRRPDIAARVTAKREQGDRIVLGGLTFTLPMFDRGQGITASATARVRRLEQERDAARRAIVVGIETELAAFDRRAEAVARLRDEALPSAEDNEGLALRSYDAGEISLMNLLLVRQDVTAVRLSYVDALTDAAVAAIEIDARAGVLR
jgi:outer membrane protein, heavy metal efflux system